jgi:hypothetical protein
MTLRSIAAVIVLLIATTPAHAYLFGPSCNDAATVSALIAEAECALRTCRGEPLNRSVAEIKALSTMQLNAILLAKQKAKAEKQGGEISPAISEYGAFVRGFAVDMYAHLARLNLAVSRTSEISHFKNQLTCTAEITFNVAEAREALYNAIALKVYSQPDNAATLLGALENGDTNALDLEKASNRPTWLSQIDRKLRSPREITFVVNQGPDGLTISTPKALLMD